MASSYCEFVKNAERGNVHIHYHDHEYGFPIEDDNQLFGRLILEINQAGLSWTTILNKKDNFFKAYHNFDIRKVSKYGEKDRQRLLNDAGIIRNRLKIDAAIHNAGQILSLQKTEGSFKNWLDSQGDLTLKEWTSLFKKTFRFTGGEIVNEFLVSTGYLKGAHAPDCPVYKKTVRKKPFWMQHLKK